MSLKKKEWSCPFSSAEERPKKAKNTFNKEWAAKLAESDKGSFYNQERLLDELDNDHNHEASEQAEMSASRAKILLQETVKAEEIDEEKWTKLKGRSILQHKNQQCNIFFFIPSYCHFFQHLLPLHRHQLMKSHLWRPLQRFPLCTCIFLGTFYEPLPC